MTISKNGKRVGRPPTPGKPPPPIRRSVRGRPPALTEDAKTLKLLGSLGSIQCTQAEAAACMGVSRETLDSFLDKYPKAADLWEKSKESGKQSLRRMQWHAAQKGNVAMLIWLGKQCLGQHEAHQISGPGGGPIEIHVNFKREPEPAELSA